RITTPKGEYIAAVVRHEGRSAGDILTDALADAFAAISWKRSMRWGWSTQTFARPVQWIVALLDSDVLDISYGDATSGRETRGHRFLAPENISLASPDNYVEVLRAAKVMVDIDERRSTIKAGLDALVADRDGNIVHSDALLNEVTQLVEWPVPLLGEFPPALLEVPREVLITSMGTHQRYFAVETAPGQLTNAFAFISNMIVEDPSVVVAGNLRVLLARLDDAKFFFREDQKTPFTERAAGLSTIRYIEGLGSVRDRVTRIAALSARLCDLLYPGDAETKTHACRAAALCKSDLSTGMVYEFPELQGTMGRYYAIAADEAPQVAAAIEEHYMPKGASDDVPPSKAGVVVAIAEKLDALAGCFALGLVPTGSADPYGLRRAALGTIRTLIDHTHRADLGALLAAAYDQLPEGKLRGKDETVTAATEFTLGRLRAYLGANSPTDIVDAVLATLGDALPSAGPRIAALQSMREDSAFEPLAAGYKRAVNIVTKAIEAGDVTAEAVAQTANAALLNEPSEKALAHALAAAEPIVKGAIADEDFAAAAAALIGLKQPIDTFFDDVMVNVEDTALRDNRLTLLASIRDLFLLFADIGRIQVG
ncbi:MAG: glycyl-tRNA synthetase beta chain, partial [Bradymonadia bacterium]